MSQIAHMTKLSSGLSRISRGEKVMLSQVKTLSQILPLPRWWGPWAIGPRRLPSLKAIRNANTHRLLSGLALVILAGSAIEAVRGDAPEMLSPAKLAMLAATARQLFDDAQHDDWPLAEQHLRDISTLAEPIITRLNANSAPLTKAVIRSARALRDHDRAGAMHAANKIMEWAARADAGAHPDLPPQLARLSYLAREIQIETDDVEPEKLARRVLETRGCWDRLRPLLEAKGDTATAKEGEAVIHQLETAQTADALAQTQPALSKLIEHSGKTFEPASR